MPNKPKLMEIFFKITACTLQKCLFNESQDHKWQRKDWVIIPDYRELKKHENKIHDPGWHPKADKKKEV